MIRLEIEITDAHNRGGCHVQVTPFQQFKSRPTKHEVIQASRILRYLEIIPSIKQEEFDKLTEVSDEPKSL